MNPNTNKAPMTAKDMKPTLPADSHASPAPEIVFTTSPAGDEPASSGPGSPRVAGSTRPTARRTPLSQLLAALRGDKYMVGAYPPPAPPAEEQ